MSATGRLGLFAFACLLLIPIVWQLVLAMPPFGAHPLPYADLINAAAPAERHVTNMVSAVNFDYRGIDTLGEETMLVCAVTGATVLLRGQRGEQLEAHPGQVENRPIPHRSEAMLLVGRLAAPLTVLFGAYVALHGMTTPGGGFQGGVIIASGLLLLFLAEDYRGWRRLMRSWLFDGLEGLGVALYALGGLAALPLGLPFLTNILPYGQPRNVFSGGLMIIENLAVALAVCGGFVVLLIEFLEETRVMSDGEQE
ncbi:MAG TPA: MnhB domain-containing protein [Acidocella sp.]|jgi:multicomponent Na+:H+ antiporter subunit B|nr:MnhB domain-containing protein [Acidocella sp.]